MSIFQRWRLKRRLRQLKDRQSHLKAIMPHAGYVEITRLNGEIRRITEELAGEPANQRKEAVS